MLRSQYPTSAIALLQAASEIASKHDSPLDIVVECIETLARGHDNLSGTHDDLIPPSTVAALKSLLQHKLVLELAEKLAPAHTVRKFVSGCSRLLVCE